MAARRLSAIAAVAAATAVAATLVVVIGHDAPSGGTAPPVALHARAELSPAAVEFGDEIEARVVAVVDAGRVDMHRIVVDENLTPLTELGPTTRSVTRRGRLATLLLTTPVSCLTDACVNATGQVRLTLPRVRISAPGRALTLRWPPLTVSGRVTRADLASSSTALRADASPPPVTYRLSAATLATLLSVLAAVLAIVAVAVGGREAVRASAARRRRDHDALTRALVFVREAKERPVPDRRRALELLDRVLRGTRADVRDLAWSEPAPTSAQLASLVDELQDGDGAA